MRAKTLATSPSFSRTTHSKESMESQNDQKGQSPTPHSSLPPPADAVAQIEDEKSGKSNKSDSFPSTLYRMLEDAASKDFEDVVSWLPSGVGFKVHDTKEFEKKIMRKYFTNQTRYKSFLRQLNFYGFDRVRKGKGRGCLFHKMFVRGKPYLCDKITRENHRYAFFAQQHLQLQQKRAVFTPPAAAAAAAPASLVPRPTAPTDSYQHFLHRHQQVATEPSVTTMVSQTEVCQNSQHTIPSYSSNQFIDGVVPSSRLRESGMDSHENQGHDFFLLGETELIDCSSLSSESSICSFEETQQEQHDEPKRGYRRFQREGQEAGNPTTFVAPSSSSLESTVDYSNLVTAAIEGIRRTGPTRMTDDDIISEIIDTFTTTTTNMPKNTL